MKNKTYFLLNLLCISGLVFYWLGCESSQPTTTCVPTPQHTVIVPIKTETHTFETRMVTPPLEDDESEERLSWCDRHHTDRDPESDHYGDHFTYISWALKKCRQTNQELREDNLKGCPTPCTMTVLPDNEP